MPKKIRDKFSKIPDKHLRYRLRRIRAGQCQWCGKRLKSYNTLCDPCMEKNRQRGVARYARLHPLPTLPE
mgnify:CR=1 FL=1